MIIEIKKKYFQLGLFFETNFFDIYENVLWVSN